MNDKISKPNDNKDAKNVGSNSANTKDASTKVLSTKKRENYISWDEYFMAVASLSSLRSKDPNSQVGACIVNADKKIVGTGYNGFPKGCSDDIIPWIREGNMLETKYPYVCHAELNAILNSISRDLKDCTLYVVMFPCNECAKAIIQSGIRKIYYLIDKYPDSDSEIASRRLFDLSGVKYEKLNLDKKIVLELK